MVEKDEGDEIVGVTGRRVNTVETNLERNLGS